MEARLTKRRSVVSVFSEVLSWTIQDKSLMDTESVLPPEFTCSAVKEKNPNIWGSMKGGGKHLP